MEKIVLPKTIAESVQSGLNKRISGKRENKRFFASTSGLCARQTALYSVNDGDGSFSASSQFYTEIGNTVERLILQGLDQDKRLLGQGEFLPDLGHNLGGKIDALIVEYYDELNRFPCIVEIKSIENIPHKPKLAHEAQAMIYSAYIGLPVKIVYMSRCNLADFSGDLEIVEFNLPFSKNALHPFLWQVVFARLCVNNNILPDKRYSLKISHCKSVYCPFVSHCWQSFDFNEFQLNSLEPQKYSELMEQADKDTSELLSDENLDTRRKDWLRRIATKNSIAKSFLVDDFFVNGGFEWLKSNYEQNWNWGIDK